MADITILFMGFINQQTSLGGHHPAVFRGKYGGNSGPGVWRIFGEPWGSSSHPCWCWQDHRATERNGRCAPVAQRWSQRSKALSTELLLEEIVLAKHMLGHFWLVVSTQPLWKIMEWKSVGMMKFPYMIYMMENKSHVWNHQPAFGWSGSGRTSWAFQHSPNGHQLVHNLSCLGTRGLALHTNHMVLQILSHVGAVWLDSLSIGR